MKGVFWVLLSGLPYVAASQCVNSSSAEITQDGASLSHIIGQVSAAESSNGMLSAGAGSSYQIESVTGNELVEVSLLAVYPNPTIDILLLRTGDLNEPGFRVTDMAGRTVASGKASGEETPIDFSTLSSGVYHLSVHSGGSVLKTFRIIKK